MPAQLTGARELKARLRAVHQSFKPIGRAWARETVNQMRPKVPVKTGRLRKSFRVRSATQKRATVVGHYTAYFIDKGPKAHVIKARKAKQLVFPIGNRTVFARQVHHRGYRGRPFRQRAAEEALRREVNPDALVKAWNEAA